MLGLVRSCSNVRNDRVVGEVFTVEMVVMRQTRSNAFKGEEQDSLLAADGNVDLCVFLDRAF